MENFPPEILKEKSRLRDKLEKSGNIEKHAGGKIDRNIPVDLDDLSLSELDFEMSKKASSIKEQLDPRIYFAKKGINSGFIKIIFLFPFAVRFLFKGIFIILRDFLKFNNALIIRMRKGEEEILKLREKISEWSDSQIEEIPGKKD